MQNFPNSLSMIETTTTKLTSKKKAPKKKQQQQHITYKTRNQIHTSKNENK